MTNFLMDRCDPALSLFEVYEWWRELEEGECPHDLWYVIGITDCSIERIYQ